MNNQNGYTYISVLIVVFVLAITAQTTWIPTGTELQRQGERELIFRGLAYRNAIESYYLAGGENPKFPPDLGQLILDSRSENTRHIRQLYENPFGDGGWHIIPAPGGGIAGVSPNSTNKPLKLNGFRKNLSHLENAKTYSDWEFLFDPDEQLNKSED